MSMLTLPNRGFCSRLPARSAGIPWIFGDSAILYVQRLERISNCFKFPAAASAQDLRRVQTVLFVEVEHAVVVDGAHGAVDPPRVGVAPVLHSLTNRERCLSDGRAAGIARKACANRWSRTCVLRYYYPMPVSTVQHNLRESSAQKTQSERRRCYPWSWE